MAADGPRSASASERSQFERYFRSHLPLDRNARILDLGCGDGGLLACLSEDGYVDVTGIDADGAELARVGALPGVGVSQAQITTDYLRNLPDQYDLILMKEMIYYVSREEIFAFMGAVKGLLTERGRVIIEVFNGSLLSAYMTQIKDPGIKTAYNEHSLRRLLEGSGFEIEALFGQNVILPSLKGRAYLAARRLWIAVFLSLLVLDRGYDSELPTIFDKLITTVAKPK